LTNFLTFKQYNEKITEENFNYKLHSGLEKVEGKNIDSLHIKNKFYFNKFNNLIKITNFFIISKLSLVIINFSHY